MGDEKGRCQADRSFQDAYMDGEDWLDGAQNKLRSTERGGREKIFDGHNQKKPEELDKAYYER